MTGPVPLQSPTKVPTSRSSLRQLLNRARRASLARKVAALGGLVTALVVFSALWALSIETRRSTRILFADELSRHQRTLLQLQRQNLTQLISSAAIITQSPTLRSALETYRMEANVGGAPRADLTKTVERELSKLLARVDADLLLVTDHSGRIFATATSVGPSSVPPPASPSSRTERNLSAMAAVRQALDPTAAADSGELAVYRDGTVTYQVAVYPLVLDGFPIGALMLGERLDAGLVASARAAFDGEIVVTSGQTVIASTLTRPDSGIVSRLLQAQPGNRRAPSIRIAGEEFVVAPMPLGKTQTGEPVSLWLMQPLDRMVQTLSAPLRRDFILYGALAIIVAALGSGLAARSALSSFRQFVRYMRTGALTERTDQRFDDHDLPAEVRSLNESFQQLMQSISAKQIELTRRTTELTASNAVLVDEVRERERVEHELLQRDEQLRQSQKLEAIGTLAGGIAHDFNNLITAVSGFTQLAIMRVERDSPVAADLRQVVEAADRAGHLTKQLLTFSRKQVQQPTVLDVGDVVEGLVPMLDRLLGDHVTLKATVAGDLARVVSDRGQLEQVIVNLAINARDAMPRGGVLKIGVSNRPSRPSLPNASMPRPKTVVITVSDTGTGIPPAIRDRIFEPFFTTKEPGKGTGLGLSTVYGIVKQSGGMIEVDSQVGLGTTFTITLPVASEILSPEASREPVFDFPKGTETVLLVEDDPAVRAFTRRTLEDCGYTVLPAAEPLEALRLATTAPVDVILSDMMMPNMTGAQFVERFIALYPAPVVIFMSGFAVEALMSDGRSISAAFLRKPFTPSALARTVRDMLDASRNVAISAVP